MKTLKFQPHLIPLILAKEKTTTWRFFDEKNIQIGDELAFTNSDTLDVFANAKVSNVSEKPYSQIKPEERHGHARLTIEEEIAKYKKYYGEKWEPDAIVKIIYFDLI